MTFFENEQKENLRNTSYHVRIPGICLYPRVCKLEHTCRRDVRYLRHEKRTLPLGELEADIWKLKEQAVSFFYL
jgi:hypothetical protein